jgi:hypothetical protein
MDCELPFLTSRHRRLRSAFAGPQVPRRAGASSERDLRRACFLLTAYRLLPTAFEPGGMERAFRRHGIYGQDVTSDRERKD